MDYYEVIDRRRMVRSFRDEPIEEGTVERIVTVGPSAGFSQGFAYLALGSPEDRERFWATDEHNAQPERVRLAPLVVVPFAAKNVYLDRYAEPDKGQTDRDEALWPVPCWYIDTGMGALNVLHAAVAAGLGALFFGLPDEDWPALRYAFDVPDAYDPIGAIVVGHPADERIESSADIRRRKDVEELIHGGDWAIRSAEDASPRTDIELETLRETGPTRWSRPVPRSAPPDIRPGPRSHHRPSVPLRTASPSRPLLRTPPSPASRPR